MTPAERIEAISAAMHKRHLEHRVCCKCGKRQAVDAFPWRRDHRGRTNYCLACREKRLATENARKALIAVGFCEAQERPQLCHPSRYCRWCMGMSWRRPVAVPCHCGGVYAPEPPAEIVARSQSPLAAAQDDAPGCYGLVRGVERKTRRARGE